MFIIQSLLLVVTSVAYLDALSSPALYSDGRNESYGLWVLCIGWMAPLFAEQYAWYANVCFLIAIYFASKRSYQVAALFSGIGIALALDMLMLPGQRYWRDEGGATTLTYELGRGSWSWLLSQCAFFGWTVTCYNVAPTSKASTAEPNTAVVS